MRIAEITAMAAAIPQIIQNQGGPPRLFRFRSFSSFACKGLASSPNAKMGDWLRSKLSFSESYSRFSCKFLLRSNVNVGATGMEVARNQRKLTIAITLTTCIKHVHILFYPHASCKNPGCISCDCCCSCGTLSLEEPAPGVCTGHAGAIAS